jgi:hypothetical protein
MNKFTIYKKLTILILFVIVVFGAGLYFAKPAYANSCLAQRGYIGLNYPGCINGNNNPNADVSIYGHNAITNLPTSWYDITDLESGNPGNTSQSESFEVTDIKCPQTGMSAQVGWYDRKTFVSQNLGSICVNGDSSTKTFSFPLPNGGQNQTPEDGVASAYVYVSATGGQGHLSYQMQLTNGKFPLISYAANDSPTIPDTGPVWQSTDRAFGTYTGGSVNYDFDAPCNWAASSPDVYVDWNGAEDGSPQQPLSDNLALNVYDVTAGGPPLVSESGAGELGGNYDSNIYHSNGFHIISGDHYIVVWSGVDGKNEIGTSLPFSANTYATGATCQTTPTWSLSGHTTLNGGTSNVTVNSTVSNVNFNHTVTNNGPGNASNLPSPEWYVQSCYQVSVQLCQYNSQNVWRQGSLPSGSPNSIANGSSSGSGNLPYSFPSNAPPGQVYCQRIVFKDAGGANTGSRESDDGTSGDDNSSRCVTYSPQSAPSYNAECNDISVNSGNFSSANYASTADVPQTVGVPGTSATLNIQFINTGASNAIWYANKYDISNNSDLITNDIYPGGTAQAYANAHSYLNVSRTGNNATDQFTWHVHNVATSANIGYSCTIILKWNSASQAPIGHVDSVSCTSGLTGWAFDYNVVPNSINVGVWVGGTYKTGTPMNGSPFPANIYRSDVDGAYGIGGNHGFDIDLSQYEGSQSHTFYVYALGESTNGSYDGKNPLIGTVTLGPCPAPIGVLDQASCGNGVLSGWAFDPSQSGASINVDVYREAPYGSPGSIYVGRFPANIYRSDVDAAYGIGGNHGFIADISSLRDGSPHTYYVYALGTNQDRGYDNENPELSYSPMTAIACAPFYTYGTAGLRLYNNVSNQNTTQNPNSYTSTNDSASTAFCQGASPPSVNCLSTVGGVNPNFHPALNNMSCQSLVDGPNGTASVWQATPISNCPGMVAYTDNGTGPSGPISLPVQAGQSYCPIESLQYSYGVIDANGNLYMQAGPNNINGGCQTIVNEPTFKVYNSSIMSCTGGSGTGSIDGWNDDSGLYPGTGSGAQYGVISVSNLTTIGVASGQYGATFRAGGATPLGTALSFANSGAGVSTNATTGNQDSPEMGGSSGFSNSCPSYFTGNDYTDSTSISGGVMDANYTGGSGYYKTSGPLTLNNSSLGIDPATGKGNIVNLYVTGDVYILNNIIYSSSGSWTSIDQIPSFNLHVEGNIYISPDVTELDGTYTAEPNSSSADGGGNIYTCADTPDGQDFTSMPSSELWSDCKNQLLVYGSFQADKINLMRTFGSLRDEVPANGSVSAPNPSSCSNQGIWAPQEQGITCAAEVFEYSPEVYITDPNATNNNSSQVNHLEIDSETSLPPVF